MMNELEELRRLVDEHLVARKIDHIRAERLLDAIQQKLIIATEKGKNNDNV
jgi:hypothetical protein